MTFESSKRQDPSGLTTEHSKKLLSHSLKAINSEISSPCFFECFSVLSITLILFCFIIASTFLAVYILYQSLYESQQGSESFKASIESIIISVLLYLITILTVLVEAAVTKREKSEIKSRISFIKSCLESWNNEYPKKHIPNFNTATLYKVLRDNSWESVPAIMLAKGDVVRIGFGQKAPCLARFNSLEGSYNFYLKQGQKFSLKRYLSWVNIDPSDYKRLNSSKKLFFCTFTLEEMPLDITKDLLINSRNFSQSTVFQNQYDAVLKRSWYLAPLFILVVITVAAIVTFTDKPQNRKYLSIVFLYNVSCLSAPLVMFFSLGNLFRRVSVAFGNSKVLVLFNALQQNKSDFEDLADIDEFDAEALPPTKDIKVNSAKIFSKMVWLSLNHDYINLSNYNKLLENLASVTALCSVDKDGTISHVEPEQLVVPTDSSDKVLILDIEKSPSSRYGYTVSLEENINSPESHFDLMKPIANLFIESSQCEMSKKSKRLDNHYGNFKLSDFFWKSSILETCMCRLGHTIGATDEQDKFDQNKDSFNFTFYSPSHPSTKKMENISTGLVPSIEIMLKMPSSKNTQEINQEFVEIESYSFGDLELLLSQSDSMWNGKEIVCLEDSTCSEVYDCYESASVQDITCLAFGFKSISVSKPSYDRFSNMLNSSFVENNPDDTLNLFDRIVFSGLGYGTSPVSLKTKESPMNIKYDNVNENLTDQGVLKLEHTTEVQNIISNQKKIEILEESSKSRHSVISDNSEGNKLDEINHLPSTQSLPKDITCGTSDGSASDSKKILYDKLQSQKSEIYELDKIECSGNYGYDEQSYNENAREMPYYLQLSTKEGRSTEMLKRQISRLDETEVADYSAEDFELLSSDDLKNEISDNQVYLGMVTFASEPKTDVCDVIEDLSLAGIRFVYFSQSMGQQSKAFAERLGLETDWNTCILLSSKNTVDDESAYGDFDSSNILNNEFNKEIGGYYEDYEIKARLPRGIDEIKTHLKNVDDIPLQVSLFAECSSGTTSQMMQIFAEYGEIVCVIGSMLGYGNRRIFLSSHLSIAVNPLCHNTAADLDTVPAILHSDLSPSEKKLETKSSLFGIASVLNSIGCSLFLFHDTSFYTLLQVISEARRIVSALQQGLIFLVACFFSVSLINFVSFAIKMPPAIDIFGMVWVLWIICPGIAFSYLFVGKDPNCMATMPYKNLNHMESLNRFAIYGIVRILPMIISVTLSYYLTLSKLYPGNIYKVRIEDGYVSQQLLVSSQSNQLAITISQLFTYAVIVFNILLFGLTMMDRVTATNLKLVWKNKVLVVSTATSVILTSLVIMIIYGLNAGIGSSAWSKIPWYSYITGFVFPVLVLVPIQEACKVHDRNRYTRYQKILKLEFNTKLGLHSPL